MAERIEIDFEGDVRDASAAIETMVRLLDRLEGQAVRTGRATDDIGVDLVDDIAEVAALTAAEARLEKQAEATARAQNRIGVEALNAFRKMAGLQFNAGGAGGGGQWGVGGQLALPRGSSFAMGPATPPPSFVRGVTGSFPDIDVRKVSDHIADAFAMGIGKSEPKLRDSIADAIKFANEDAANDTNTRRSWSRMFSAAITSALTGGAGGSGGGGGGRRGGGGFFSYGADDGRFQAGDIARGILPGAGRAGPGALGLLGAGAAGLGAIATPAILASLAAASGLIATLGVNAGVLAIALAGTGKAIAGNKEAYDALAPSAQKFVNQIREIIPWAKELRVEIQDKMLPGIAAGFAALTSPAMLGALKTGLGAIATEIGNSVARIGEAFGSADFAGKLGKFLQDSTGWTHNLVTAFIELSRAAITVLSSIDPLLDWMTEGIAKGSQMARMWLDNKVESGGFAKSMDAVKDSIRILSDALGSVIGFLYELGDVMSQPVAHALELAGDALDELARVLRENQEEIREFINGGLSALEDVVKTLWPIVLQLAGSLNKVAEAIGGWENAWKIVIGGILVSKLLAVETGLYGVGTAAAVAGGEAGVGGLVGKLALLTRAPFTIAIITTISVKWLMDKIFGDWNAKSNDIGAWIVDKLPVPQGVKDWLNSGPGGATANDTRDNGSIGNRPDEGSRGPNAPSKPKPKPKPQARPNANISGDLDANQGALDFARAVGMISGEDVYVSSGYRSPGENAATGGSKTSEHMSGNAVDISASGERLIKLGQAALIAAGMDPAEARKQRGGLYNVNGYQIIFNTHEGGDHTDHLHVGVGRASGPIRLPNGASIPAFVAGVDGGGVGTWTGGAGTAPPAATSANTAADSLVVKALKTEMAHIAAIVPQGLDELEPGLKKRLDAARALMAKLSKDGLFSEADAAKVTASLKGLSSDAENSLDTQKIENKIKVAQKNIGVLVAGGFITPEQAASMRKGLKEVSALIVQFTGPTSDGGIEITDKEMSKINAGFAKATSGVDSGMKAVALAAAGIKVVRSTMQDALKDGIITDEELDAVENKLKGLEGKIAKGMQAAVDAVQIDRTAFRKAFDDFVGYALKAFDKAHEQMYAALKASVTFEGITFSFGAGDMTPAEKELADRAAAREKKQITDRVADAKKLLDDARQKEGESQDAWEERRAELQGDYNEAIYDQQTYYLGLLATGQRQAAEEALGIIQSEERDKTEAKRIGFEAGLRKIGEDMALNAISYKTGLERIKALFAEYEVPFGEQSGILGEALKSGLMGAFGKMVTAMESLAESMEALLRRFKITAGEAKMTAAEMSATEHEIRMIEIRANTAAGGEANYNPPTNTSTTQEAPSPGGGGGGGGEAPPAYVSPPTPGVIPDWVPGGVRLYAKGGVIDSMTHAVMGEGGPEAVFPIPPELAAALKARFGTRGLTLGGFLNTVMEGRQGRGVPSFHGSRLGGGGGGQSMAALAEYLRSGQGGGGFSGGDTHVNLNVADGMNWLRNFIQVEVKRSTRDISYEIGRESSRRLRGGRVNVGARGG